MNLDLLQWPGAALGLIGALLVAMASPHYRRLGFILWLGSNACLITWAVWARAWPLAGMYAFYFATSVLGVWNNRGTGSI